MWCKLAGLLHKWGLGWGIPGAMVIISHDRRPMLADSLLFSVNNILAGLWLDCISSVEITFFLLADILLQHRALFQCLGLVKSF